MGKNVVIKGVTETVKIIITPFIPFIMLWVKLYTFIAYMITSFAHMLTFGHYPVTRNPILVLLAIPLIQILLIPSIIIMLIKGGPSSEAMGKAVEDNIFDKYKDEDDYYKYNVLTLE